jgi:hypothetical protein
LASSPPPAQPALNEIGASDLMGSFFQFVTRGQRKKVAIA